MPNCYKNYAQKDSYVVVTGGSDGIGLEICKKMAKQGFNICMVSRNEEKMRIKLEEVLSVCTTKVKTMYLVADFATMSTIQDY